MKLKVLTEEPLDLSEPVLVGLTGGIGAGKSAVGRGLREHGALVVDADTLARQVVEIGTPGLSQLVDTFGPDVLRADGSLDRGALAALVFRDRELLAALEGITHPLIEEARKNAFSSLQPGQVGVYEVPLLVERKMGSLFDAVVVVEAPTDIRFQRLLERGLAQDEAQRRMESQASAAERRAIADYVLVNDSDPETLAEATRCLGKLLGL